MCEYCGCRRIPEIARLGAEHDIITELADEADAWRANTETRDVALRRLRAALVPHAEREERGVFTEARRAGLTGYYVEELEDDHHRFKEALDDPESIDDATMGTLLKDLDRHIAIEEYDLFPAAAKYLSAEQWGVIEDRQAKAQDDVGTSINDRSWSVSTE